MTPTETAELIKCECCGNTLEECEIEYLRSEDETICGECYHERYEFTCHWCEEYGEKSEECAIGSLFVLFESVRSRPPCLQKQPDWYDSTEREMRAGVYRITKWPMYWDAMLDSGLYAESFEWVLPLPEELARNGGYAGYPCGPLCPECQRKLEAEAERDKAWSQRERMIGRRRG